MLFAQSEHSSKARSVFTSNQFPRRELDWILVRNKYSLWQPILDNSFFKFEHKFICLFDSSLAWYYRHQDCATTKASLPVPGRNTDDTTRGGSGRSRILSWLRFLQFVQVISFHEFCLHLLGGGQIFTVFHSKFSFTLWKQGKKPL